MPAACYRKTKPSSLALWNNPAFLDLLVDLDLSRADVITAGQLTNPELWSVFPVGPKQFEMALNVPLEAIWLRPRRVSAAELTNRRVGQRLVQDGLNLVRDVRVDRFVEVTISPPRCDFEAPGASPRRSPARGCQSARHRPHGPWAPGRDARQAVGK